MTHRMAPVRRTSYRKLIVSAGIASASGAIVIGVAGLTAYRSAEPSWTYDAAPAEDVHPAPPQRSGSRTPTVTPRRATSPPSTTAGAHRCDPAYGRQDQCVPATFPPGTDDRCRWLHDHGIGPLAVHGTDRQHLDADHDGTACTPADRT